MTFKLTYSTMFDPPEEMHTRFEAALAEVRAGLGATHPMFIDGADVAAGKTAENRSPIDQLSAADEIVFGVETNHLPLEDEPEVTLCNIEHFLRAGE